MTTKEKTMASIGDAVTALYNLDLFLSNCFLGKPRSVNDRTIKKLRRVIGKALDDLDSRRYVDLLAKL